MLSRGGLAFNRQVGSQHNCGIGTRAFPERLWAASPMTYDGSICGGPAAIEAGHSLRMNPVGTAKSVFPEVTLIPSNVIALHIHLKCSTETDPNAARWSGQQTTVCLNRLSRQLSLPWGVTGAAKSCSRKFGHEANFSQGRTGAVNVTMLRAA
ncbi:hypothetical protein BDW22DRAFT_1354449 [Trametopsis cervina]|nr:hypothetical protein BDW22DRAFT_1354449 [Trametopsis cervina]